MSALTYTFRALQETDGVFVYQFHGSMPETPMYRFGPVPDAEAAKQLIDERIAAINEMHEQLRIDLLCFGSAVTHISEDGTVRRVDPAELQEWPVKHKEQP